MSSSTNWRRRAAPHSFKRTIKLDKTYYGLVIGQQGSNIQHFRNTIKNLLTVSVEDCGVKVTASTAFALDAVEARINALILARDSAILYDEQNKLICRNLPKIRKYYGIELEFDGKKFVSDTVINAELEDYLSSWVHNVVFIDDEKVWNRRPQQKQSSFIDSVLLPSIFLRKLKANKLLVDKLIKKEGIDYIDVLYEQTDVFAKVNIGCDHQQQYEECVKILMEKLHYNIDDIVLKGHHAPNECYPSKKIPIPIAEDLRKKQSLVMNLDLIKTDPCLVSLTINHTEGMLTITCTTDDTITRAIHLIMGALSFNKAQAGRKFYHCVYQEHYKTGCKTFDQRFTAKLLSEDSQCDSTSFCWDANKYLFIPVPSNGERSSCSHRGGTDHCLYDQDIMISQFRRFLKFSDFSIVENISVFVKFGLNRFVFQGRNTPELNTPGARTTHPLYRYLSYSFRLKPIFSYDLKISAKELIRVLQQSENYKHSSKSVIGVFTDVYFNDLSSNAQYSARISGDNEIIYTRQVKQHHCHFRVIDLVRCKVDSMTVVASQQEVKDELIQEFLAEFIDSGDLSSDGQMFMTNRFSIYNISKVTQTSLELGGFVVYVDDVQKKTYQRFGKFANYCNVRTSYPELDAAMKKLQNCKEGNKDYVVKYFVDILKMADTLSECMDKLFI